MMCTKCVTIKRVPLKGSSRLTMGGETNSKVKYLFNGSAVEIASARWIA